MIDVKELRKWLTVKEKKIRRNAIDDCERIVWKEWARKEKEGFPVQSFDNRYACEILSIAYNRIKSLKEEI